MKISAIREFFEGKSSRLDKLRTVRFPFFSASGLFRLAFLSARARARLHLHKDAVCPVFPGGGNPGLRGVNCVSFVEYMCRVRVAHTRLHLHLYFASEWTSAVKLKRNHREFLCGWLSREDPFSSPRRTGTVVIGGTFLSKCSFPSRHPREHESRLIARPQTHPRGHVLPRADLYTVTFTLSLATGIHKTSRNTEHKANSRDPGSDGEIWWKRYFPLAPNFYARLSKVSRPH